MSLGEVQRFYSKIRHDFDFFQLFNKTLLSVPDEKNDQAIVQFAKELGFNFSVEEFRRFINTPEFSEFKNNLHRARVTG